MLAPRRGRAPEAAGWDGALPREWFAVWHSGCADPPPTPSSPLAPRAQDPASQLSQLVALEHLVAVALPERTKEAPLVLKELYDSDIVAEELILAWWVLGSRTGEGGCLGDLVRACGAVELILAWWVPAKR